MSKLIKIGLPSKGRLKEESLKVFRKNKLFIKDSKRNYLSKIKNFETNEIIFSHAREIVERLADNSLDVGISGYDLLKESLPGIQKKIQIYSRQKFGFAKLVVAVPNDWIDVQTIADLEEISFEFKAKNIRKLRVATKYPNLTNEFLLSKGLTQYKIVNSLGSTEVYPFTDQFEFEIKALSVYLNHYLTEQFLLNPRENFWLTGGLHSLLLMEYVEYYYPNQKLLGAISRQPLLKPFLKNYRK